MPRDQKGQPPNCPKCGKDHWRFVACESVDDFLEVQRKRKDRIAPHVVRVERRDGLEPWGDRLETLTRTGPNVFGTPRTAPMRTGSLTYPPDREPPDAA